MFAPALRGVWSTWTSAAGKTYAVDWDNIFKTFGNNVTSDPNWIIKAMDAGYASGGPRVQVNTVPAFNPAQTPIKQAPSSTITNSQQVVSPQGRIVFGPMITINPVPQQVQSNGPIQITPVNVPNLQPGNWTVYTNTQAQPSQPANPEGVPMSQFDFSTLPKMRAHAQLGRLGDPSGCSIYDPTSYGTCATWIIQGRTELADAHNAILDLANAWQATLQSIQSWPDSQSKSDALAQAQQAAQDAVALVQQHTQVQNDYEAAIAPYTNIGLAGLWKSSGGTAGLWKSGQGLGRLGIAPIIWGLIVTTTLVIAALSAWGIASALAMKQAYEAQTACYNAFTQFYKDCALAAATNKPCSYRAPAGCNALPSPGGDMMTYLLIGGIGLLALMLIKR